MLNNEDSLSLTLYSFSIRYYRLYSLISLIIFLLFNYYYFISFIPFSEKKVRIGKKRKEKKKAKMENGERRTEKQRTDGRPKEKEGKKTQIFFFQNKQTKKNQEKKISFFHI